MNLCERAEKALRTGQPNLAATYMRRALSDTPQGRAWLARHDFTAWVRDAAARVGITLDMPCP